MAKILIKKMVPSANLILRVSTFCHVCSRSVGGTYGTGGQIPRFPFSHLESFNPSGILEDKLFLEESRAWSQLAASCMTTTAELIGND